MGLFTINTGWGRAEPGSSSFLDGWMTVLNGIVGRWGRNLWTPIDGGAAYYWRMTAGMCSFQAIPIERGDVDFTLPTPPVIDTVINVGNTISGVTTITQNVILAGMGVATLHLAGDTCFVWSNYETEK